MIKKGQWIKLTSYLSNIVYFFLALSDENYSPYENETRIDVLVILPPKYQEVKVIMGFYLMDGDIRDEL